MNRLKSEYGSIGELSRDCDQALSDVEDLALAGIVSNTERGAGKRSYFFLDSGVLKFYNATTGLTKSVTLS